MFIVDVFLLDISLMSSQITSVVILELSSGKIKMSEFLAFVTPNSKNTKYFSYSM